MTEARLPTTAENADEAIRVLSAGVDFPDEARRQADATFGILDTMAAGVETRLPSKAVAQRLGFDYWDTLALTELNGARVRINAALDEFEDVPTQDLIPPVPARHITEALVAGWALVKKISDKEDAAPSATDRVVGGAAEAGGDVGDLLSGPILEFLNRMVSNLWFYLALAGAVVFLVYVKPRLGGVA